MARVSAPTFRWIYRQGCGGTRVYQMIDDNYVYCTVQKEGDWHIWIISLRRRLPVTYDRLRDAKAAAEQHFEDERRG